MEQQERDQVRSAEAAGAAGVGRRWQDEWEEKRRVIRATLDRDREFEEFLATLETEEERQEADFFYQDGMLVHSIRKIVLDKSLGMRAQRLIWANIGYRPGNADHDQLVEQIVALCEEYASEYVAERAAASRAEADTGPADGTAGTRH